LPSFHAYSILMLQIWLMSSFIPGLWNRKQRPLPKYLIFTIYTPYICSWYNQLTWQFWCEIRKFFIIKRLEQLRFQYHIKVKLCLESAEDCVNCKYLVHIFSEKNKFSGPRTLTWFIPQVLKFWKSEIPLKNCHDTSIIINLIFMSNFLRL